MRHLPNPKELFDDNGKRHTRMGVTRPDPNLLNKSEAEIIKILNAKLQEYPLAKLLRDVNVVVTKCGHDVDSDGFVIEQNGEVVVSLWALADIVSLALNLAANNSHVFKITDQYVAPHRVNNTVDECLNHVAPLCLTFNSIQVSNHKNSAFDEKRDKFLQITMPLSHSQERYSTTQRQLLARCHAWFTSIPQTHNCPTPSIIDDFIEETYGIRRQDLAVGAFALYAVASQHHLITPITFQNIDNAHNHPANRLLKYARPISFYQSTTIEEMEKIPDKIQALPLSTPLLVAHPIIHLGEGLWSIPIPRLILNTLVETLHWNIFDHCYAKEGHRDNSYMNWFGTVFEWYVRDILMSSYTRKMMGEYVYSSQDKSPDLMEININRALIVEAKARRPRFFIKQFQSADAVLEVQKFILETLKQFLNFLERHCCDKIDPLPKLGAVNDYIILIVTPEMWPANQYVESGIAEKEISRIISKFPHIKRIRLCYVPVSDIEIIPRLKGHHFAYDLIDSYLTSDFYPSSGLGDFIRMKSFFKNMPLANPYVNEQFKTAFETCKKITFNNVDKP